MPFTKQNFSCEESKTLYPELQGRYSWLDSLSAAVDSESGASLISISYLIGYDREHEYRFDENGKHTKVEYSKNEGFVWQPSDELSVAEINTKSRKIQEAIGCLIAEVAGPNPPNEPRVHALLRPKDALRKIKTESWLTLAAIVSAYLVILSLVFFWLFGFI
ncbi:MAG: hypothetical protein H7293_17185 [Candidatus Saccharibacteria bacterium]|nr:hypothetical protein [Rhodoferax sp.]